MPLTPEQRARELIDAKLEAAGWVVQDMKQLNLGAGFGVAVREYPTDTGPADYILFAGREPVGVIEAKRDEAGTSLSTHETQTERYANAALKWRKGGPPLRFLYESTGQIIFFTDGADPVPRARELFHFFQPKTLAEWAAQPDTLRRRLTQMPPLPERNLRDCQISAVTGLEKSLARNKPRALVHMATGAGKTFTAITSVYRLLKFGGARRILFLVDTRNLGKQAHQEFMAYTPPDDGRKFTELYNVQRLASSHIDPHAQVCISTIQRMYSILSGTELAEDSEDISLNELGQAGSQARLVQYNPQVPIEEFDFIVIDECHRSIYNLWKQVLDYFDAFLIGLTATPDKRTYGFFNENVVAEYSYEQSVVDGVNVGYDVYEIETEITAKGAELKAREWIDHRDRETRAKRLAQTEEDMAYGATDLDKSVVNPSQIRNVIEAMKNAVETSIFPNRKETPKTLIFAKTDSHADDIIRTVREVYGEGNAFCKKVTYRAGTDPDTGQNVPGDDADSVLASFRNDYHPRIAVTVDMIATGTDVKPLELLLFMRDVKSKNYFEQMKGRGTRTLDADGLRKVTPSANGNKTHFVIVDAVGVLQSCKSDSRPLERKPGVSLKDLMMQVVLGHRDEDTLTSLANRLTRLEKQLAAKEKEQFQEKAGGRTIQQVVHALLDAHDPDAVAAQPNTDLPKAATALFDDPAFREYVENVRRKHEQLIDTVNLDQVTYAGPQDRMQEQAAAVVQTFKDFIAAKRDELTALGIYYGQPYRRRELTFRMVQQVAEALQQPPWNLTSDRVWASYERALGLKKAASPQRQLTDLVALIRYELGVDTELRPYADTVRKNFQDWAFRKQAGGAVKFTEAQMAWLHLVRDHIATSVHLDRDDLELGTMGQQGGLARMYQLFGEGVDGVIDELNEMLAA